MTRFASIVPMIIIAAIPAEVSAQRRASKIDHETCVAATSIVASSAQVHAQSEAMRLLLSCRELPAQVLPQLWANPSDVREHLQLLFELSRRNRTDVLYAALLESVRDRSLGSEARVAALGSLALFLAPDLGMSLEFRPLEGLEPLLWDNIWARGLPHRGGLRLTPTREAEVVHVIQSLVADADDKVSSAAWWLAAHLGIQTQN